MDIVCYINQVPDAVWAAIIASLLTLSGVWLTNKGNNQRLLNQLEHDAKERACERQMSIRREVYLKAAEAIPKAFSTIMGLPKADMQSPSWVLNTSLISESLMKVHIVGTDDTVTAITRFSSEFSRAILDLTQKRLPLDDLKSRSDTLSNQADKSTKERDRYLELMKEFHLQGSFDQILWDKMMNNFDLENKRANDYTNNYVLALQQYADLLLDLVKD